jgi:hypothetical protein
MRTFGLFLGTNRISMEEEDGRKDRCVTAPSMNDRERALLARAHVVKALKEAQRLAYAAKCEERYRGLHAAAEVFARGTPSPPSSRQDGVPRSFARSPSHGGGAASSFAPRWLRNVATSAQQGEPEAL